MEMEAKAEVVQTAPSSVPLPATQSAPAQVPHVNVVQPTPLLPPSGPVPIDMEKYMEGMVANWFAKREAQLDRRLGGDIPAPAATVSRAPQTLQSSPTPR